MLHWLRPIWLCALIPWLGVLFYVWRTQRKQSVWQHACDPHLLPHLITQHHRRHFPLLFWIGVIGLCGIIALAGPSWSRVIQPVYQQTIPRVILLDLSPNMNATDLKPSRLVRAKYKIRDILAQIQEGSTGFIAFSSQPFVVTPLTQDTATIAAMLAELNPGMMPVSGSRLTPALDLAAQLFMQANYSRGEILVITASPVRAEDLQTAAALRKIGITTSVLGVGTLKGAPIPTGSGFVKNAQKQLVMTTLNERQLRALAQQGGGRYVTMTASARDVKTILKTAPQVRSIKQTKKMWQQWQDQGYWLLLVIVPGVALLFRRGWLTKVWM